jgi:tripartite-type tricarboxylate transporter receptor subunit TctC
MGPIFRYLFAGVIPLCAVSLAAGAVPAAEFYKGKTLTLWIGGGVSGSTNLIGRTFVKHAARHLPGKPDFAARNLPGAGGIGAVRTLYGRAAKDGTHIGTWALGPVTDPLLNTKKKWGYDMLKFNWLGNMASQVQVCLAWKGAGFATIQDVFDKPMKISSTGARSNGTKVPLALNEAIGTRFRPVLGYRGPGGANLAVERKEVVGRCASYETFRSTKADWVAGGKVNYVVQVGNAKHPDIPNVAFARDHAKTAKDKALVDFVAGPLAISNPFALPPGVPDARLREWRAAWAATMKDPAFLAEMKRYKFTPKPNDGAKVLSILKVLYATPADVVNRAAKAFKTRTARCNPKVSKKCRGKRKRKKKG